MSPSARAGPGEMSDATGGFDPSHLDGFVGAWTVDGAHALLPGEPVAELRDDGRVVEASGELSRDGATWEQDLSLTYRRRP